MFSKKAIHHKMRLQFLWATGLLLATAFPSLAQNPACGFETGDGCPNTDYNNSFMNSSDPATLEYDNWVSTFHSTMVRRSDGQFSVWGSNIGNAGDEAADVLSPQLLNKANYPALTTGAKILKVTGGSGGPLSHEQFIALASDGLYAWGYQDVVIAGSLTSSTVFQKLTINGQPNGLPPGLVPTDIKMMTAAVGTLVLVTCSGEVWVLSKNTAMRGIGNSGSSTVWAQVTTDGAGNPPLTNVVAARTSNLAVIALSTANQLYTWGSDTRLANNDFSNVHNRAKLMTHPNVAKTIKMFQVLEGPSFHVLMSDGNLYAVGSNSIRQLGNWTTTSSRVWLQPRYNSATGPVMNNIQWISGNENDYFYPAMNVLTTGGTLYCWGSNNGLMIGRDNDFTNYDPGIPNNLSSSDEIIGVETGGHTSMIAKCDEANFGYVGHRTEGSMGNGSAADINEPVYTFNTASVPICGTNLPYFDAYQPGSIRATGGQLCVGTVYNVVAEPSGGTVTVSNPSLVLLGGNATDGYTIQFTAAGSATITYQGLPQNGCTPGAISEVVTAASCNTLSYSCVNDNWIDGNTGLPVDLSANNSSGFENYTLIMNCCDEEGVISGQLTIGDIQINCGDVVVEGCLTVNTGGNVTIEDPVESAIIMRATTDIDYGQYFGPPAQIEFEMIMLEDGWHNLALPVADATAQDLADQNNTLANPLLINVDGLTSFEGDANIELYNSAISGAKEMGFVRTDGLYSTHAYGKWTPAEASAQLAKTGFNYYINPYFTNGERKLRVRGVSLEEDVVTATSDNFGGWNLIPNPYPVTIDVQEMYDQGFFNQGNNISNPLLYDAAVWIWDGSETFTPSPPFVQTSGSYILHDAITGTPVQNGNNLPTSAAYVAPFQSFWVRRTTAFTARRMDGDGTDLQAVAMSVPLNATTDPSPMDKADGTTPLSGVGGPLTGPNTATVKPSFRANCNITKHYKSQSNVDVIKLRVSSVQNSGLFDETLLTFGSDFTPGYDLGYDIVRNSAIKGAPFLVSDVDKKGLAINRLPYPTATTQVPLFFDVEGQNHPYELRINEATAGYTIFVEDLANGKWHYLSNDSYFFTNDVNYKGTRFILHFKLGPADIAEFQPQVRAWRNKEGLQVQFNNIRNQKARVRIADATGRTLLNVADVDTNFDFVHPVEHLAAGVYFITVITDNGSWVEKISL